MGQLTGSIKRKLMGLSRREIDFQYRGFLVGNPQKRACLEASGAAFVDGFNLALEYEDLQDLTLQLNQRVELAFSGFAYEGAGMALYLLDLLTPWNRNRFRDFLAGPGEKHYYMALIGAGWAMGRLCRNFEGKRQKMHPFWSWLTVDGYGFHEGFFKPRLFFVDQKQPRDLDAYGLQVFDQGLGRAMWFYCCADVEKVIETLLTFHPQRHPALWAGIGLACTYAGGVNGGEIEMLKAVSGEMAGHLAQGSAFAAKARSRAGNLTTHNHLATGILCAMSAEEAAGITDKTLGDLAHQDTGNGFETWRGRIREQLLHQRIMS